MALSLNIVRFAKAQGLEIEINPTINDLVLVNTVEIAEKSFITENDGNSQLVISGTDLTAIRSNQLEINAGEGGAVIDSDNLKGSPHEVILLENGISNDLVADTSYVDFGSVTVRDSSFYSFTITNEGRSNVTIDSLEFSGPGANWFSLSSPFMSFTIAAGATQSLEVKFSPTDDTEQNAQLTLYSITTSTLPLLLLDLQGKGLNPSISITPEVLDFGPVLWGIDSTQVLTITNEGPGDLVIDSLRIRGPSASMFFLPANEPPYFLQPEESTDFSITFSPFGNGNQSVDIQIFSNSSSNTRLDHKAIGQSKLIEKNFSVAPIGQDFNISFNIPDHYSSSPKELFYRMPGDPSYRLVNLRGQLGMLMSGTIPGVVLTEIGIEYYVKVTSGIHSSTIPTRDPNKSPEFLPVFMESIELPLETSPRTYQMISIPFELVDYSPVSMFFDDYGTYNPRSWRLLRWQGDQYNEYPNLNDSLARGKGFWLITEGGETFDLDQALSANSRDRVLIELEPGWNQIGNPFAFTIDWDNRALDPRIGLPVGFDGTSFQHQQTSLKPWQGYFINNLTSDTVNIVLQANAVPSPLVGKSSTNYIQYSLNLSTYLSEYPEIIDPKTVVGIAREAKEAHDFLDYTTPPPIGDFIQTRIRQDGVAYAGNFKPPSDEGQTWDFEVISSVSWTTASIMMTSSSLLPEGHSIYLLDLDNGAPVMVSDSVFTLSLKESQVARRFRLIIGTEELALELSEDIPLTPVEFDLEQNFPNPFRDRTNIIYHIDQNTSARIEIYDLVGRKIRTLVNRLHDMGTHSVIWDGQNDASQAVANGVYFYKLHTEHGVMTKKMMVLK